MEKDEDKEYIMMEPPIDELVAKVGNKFMLNCLVAKRAKQLNSEYLMGEQKELLIKHKGVANDSRSHC